MKKKSIEIQPSHEGRLHRRLGIPEGETIPLSTLLEHKNSSDLSLREMVNFAINERGWKKKGKKSK